MHDVILLRPYTVPLPNPFTSPNNSWLAVQMVTFDMRVANSMFALQDAHAEDGSVDVDLVYQVMAGVKAPEDSPEQIDEDLFRHDRNKHYDTTPVEHIFAEAVTARQQAEQHPNCDPSLFDNVAVALVAGL